MKRLLSGFILAVMALGLVALVLPTPTAEARPCVFCPQIAIECGTCYKLQPQTCTTCAYCKHIPGCHE